MAGDPPMLSAFAARKRLLAKASESKSSSSAEDGDGGSAVKEAAQKKKKPKGLTEMPPADGSGRDKRMTARNKRQRVEATVGEGGEKKVTIRAGVKTESSKGRQSPAKRETTEEPSQPRTPRPTARSLTAEMDVDDGTRAARPSPPESQAPGATPGTPARNPNTSTAPVTAAQESLPASFLSSVSKDIIRDSITAKDNGVVELRIDHGEVELAVSHLHFVR